MANTVNYAQLFERQLTQKYTAELASAVLRTQNVTFTGGKAVRFPFITVSGYQDHSRQFNGIPMGDLTNDWFNKTMEFDRSVQFFVDEMDVDETNYALTAANVTNVFMTEQAIPEEDRYNFSKIYTEFTTLGGTVDNTALTAANVLATFDAAMEAMDEVGVPMGDRQLFVTPPVMTLIKNATQIQRSLNVNTNNNVMDRRIFTLDATQIHTVPSDRFMTAYDFSNGSTPAVGALQMNMIIVSTSAIIACNKHSYIRLWPEGTHTHGDGWLYQNRKYSDLWVIPNRLEGVYINVTP